MTAPICLEKSANLLKCFTMTKVKLYHKQLSVFYRNEYNRVCIRRMQCMPDAIYFNTLAVSTPHLARIPICQPPCGSADVCKLQHFFSEVQGLNKVNNFQRDL